MLHRKTLLCPACRLYLALTYTRSQCFIQAPRRFLQTKTNSKSKTQQPRRKSLSTTLGHPRPATRRNEPLAGMNRRYSGVLPVTGGTKPRENRAPTAPRKHVASHPHDGKRIDMKALNSQRALSQISYLHRAKIKNQINGVKGFEDFSLLPEVLDSLYSEALCGMSSVSPTPIQRLAIPYLRQVESLPNTVLEKGDHSFKSYLLAAETGSGKTLAYLIPAINNMKQRETTRNATKAFQNFIFSAEEAYPGSKGPLELDSPPTSGRENGLNRHPQRPKIVVLLPTAELVEQVGSLFKIFSHTVKFRVALLSARYSATVIRNRLFGAGGVDVLVSTPHILGNIAESDPNILSCVTHLIIDEADSLFDRSFAPLTTAIIDRSAPSMEKMILSSATIPRSLDTYLQRRFPDIIRLATPNVHAIPRRVQLNVVDIDRVPYQGNRDLACADAIRSIGRESSTEQIPDESFQSPLYKGPKCVIVFVNDREKTSHVANYLSSKGITASSLDRDTTEGRKSKPLSVFMGMELDRAATPTKNVPYGAEMEHQRRSPNSLPNVNVIVMTDLGSRGIDTLAVRHVILYDVPHTTIDFIHRLGRTGRMGRRGRGIVLVGKGDRKDIVREVRHGMYKGQALT